MNPDSLVQASQFLHDDINTQRESLRYDLVRLALSSNRVGYGFEIESIRETISEEFGVTLGEAAILEQLEKLEDEGVIYHTDRGGYSINDTLNIPNISEIYEPVWREYSRFYRENYKTRRDFTNDKLESAFKNFLSNFLSELVETTIKLSEFRVEEFYQNDFSYVAFDAAEEAGLHNEEAFVDSVVEYLQNPGDHLSEFTSAVYTTIVNVDLLVREDKDLISLEDIEEDRKIILLDTNVLVSLLSDTDRTHPLINAVCSQAERLGFQIGYLPETADEMEILVGGTIRELSQTRKRGQNSDITKSQFAEDYLNKEEIGPDEYKQGLRNWDERLEEEFNVIGLELSSPPDSLLEKSERLIRRVDERTNGTKQVRKIRHDATLLATGGNLQSAAGSDTPQIGPIILSRDASLVDASFTGAETAGWGSDLVLFPRVFSNYMMTYSSAEVSQDAKNEVANALLRGAASSNKEISLKDYARLLVPKLGLEKGDEKLLTEYWDFYGVSSEIEDLIEGQRADVAEELSNETLRDSEAIKEFRKERESQQKLQNAAQSVREREERIERLEKQNSEMKKKLDNIEDSVESDQSEYPTEINFSPTINAKLESNQSNTVQITNKALISDINEFSNELKEALPNGYKESEFSPPPDDKTKAESIKSWLRDTSTAMAASELPPAVAELHPEAIELLEKVATSI